MAKTLKSFAQMLSSHPPRPTESSPVCLCLFSHSVTLLPPPSPYYPTWVHMGYCHGVKYLGLLFQVKSLYGMQQNALNYYKHAVMIWFYCFSPRNRRLAPPSSKKGNDFDVSKIAKSTPAKSWMRKIWQRLRESLTLLLTFDNCQQNQLK